jgi:hypothetical protein
MQNAKQEMQNVKSILLFAFPVLHFEFRPSPFPSFSPRLRVLGVSR